jgi:hypothetical protein
VGETVGAFVVGLRVGAFVVGLCVGAFVVGEAVGVAVQLNNELSSACHPALVLIMFSHDMLALRKILVISTPALTFHADKSWLKAMAYSNISFAPVTALTLHDEISWLNFFAPKNA